MGRIRELDALRGIAAMAVVLFHYTTRYDQRFGHTSAVASFAFGTNGVYLFFGISGFVIFMTLEGISRPMDFVVSRFSRLYPVYWAGILITTLVVILGPLTELRREPGEIAANALMFHSLLGVRHVDTVYWTLVIELFFYAVMLGIFITGLLNRIEWVLLPWIALKWTPVALPALATLPGLDVFTLYIPYFAIGICAYRYRKAQALVLAVAAWALITIALVDGPERFAIAAISTVTLFSLRQGWLVGLINKPLLWLGAISYPLYLVHEYVGWSVIAALESRGVAPYLAIAVAIGTALAIASALTVLVERPALRGIRAWYKSTRAAQIPADR